LKVHKQTFFSRNHSRISGTAPVLLAKSRDFVLGHNKSAPGLCFHTVSVSSGEVHYFALSAKLKNGRSNKYVHSYISGTINFCTSNQALVPVHQAWTAPTISNIHWLECSTAVLSQRSGFESQQV